MLGGRHDKPNRESQMTNRGCATMRFLRALVVLVLCLLAIPSLQAQTKKITAAEAKDHVGDRATVCGKAASTHYAKSSKGEPTFLHLDEPYPKEVFTILIWDRIARSSAHRNSNTRACDCA